MATMVKEKVRFNPEPEPEGACKTAEELAAEETLIAKVWDYIDRNGLEPDFFKEMRNHPEIGGAEMTLDEINAVIRASRADRAARLAKAQ